MPITDIQLLDPSLHNNRTALSQLSPDVLDHRSRLRKAAADRQRRAKKAADRANVARAREQMQAELRRAQVEDMTRMQAAREWRQWRNQLLVYAAAEQEQEAKQTPQLLEHARQLVQAADAEVEGEPLSPTRAGLDSRHIQTLRALNKQTAYAHQATIERANNTHAREKKRERDSSENDSDTDDEDGGEHKVRRLGGTTNISEALSSVSQPLVAAALQPDLLSQAQLDSMGTWSNQSVQPICALPTATAQPTSSQQPIVYNYEPVLEEQTQSETDENESLLDYDELYGNQEPTAMSIDDSTTVEHVEGSNCRRDELSGLEQQGWLGRRNK